MGFLTRFFSVGGKSKRKNVKHDKHDKPQKNAASSSTPGLLPIPQDQEAVVNRLLRSSSTHFSILSETEYRSLPPIPHPINNVFRAPSIISSATQSDTYTVTVHRRMLHSRTVFPNANRSGNSSPGGSPNRRHSSTQLTPEEKNRLLRLKQETSVLSLINIYDDTGCPDPQAFSNTPVRRERNDASLRVLLGQPTPQSLSTSKTSAEESDISWADRYIRTARHDSTCSSLTTSSLGIPDDLFKSSISPERLYLDQLDINSSSRDLDVGIDSLQVERGTAEDSSMIIHPSVIGLTSPTRRASQFFKFLSEGGDPPTQSLDPLPDTLSTSHQPPSPQGSRSKQSIISLTVEDDSASRGTKFPVLHVRDGPKESLAQISPAPRRRLQTARAPPVPTQPQSTARSRSLQPKPPPQLGRRAPFDELRNTDGSDTHVVPRNVSSRSVSVASSVYPHIERQELDMGADPYTPLPSRRTVEGRKERHSVAGENIPPNAPARPARGQARKYTSRDCQCARPARRKDSLQNALPSQNTSNEQSTLMANSPCIDGHVTLDAIPPTTPPTTPVRNHALMQLQTPSRPSPASSSELSPEGRQIMANIRSKASKSSQYKVMTPRAWQAWGGTANP